MILGIGIDLVDSRRIQKLLSRAGSQAIDKLCTQKEIQFYQKNISGGFAKIFAAKEAVIKAMALSHPCAWHDIEMNHHINGQPFIVLHKSLLQSLIQEKASSFKSEDIKIHLSLTDERPYVSALCIIEVMPQITF